MLRILLLLCIIRDIKSYNIELYDVKLQAHGPSNIKVSLRIRKEIEHLNGYFSVRHNTCSGRGNCATAKYGNDFPFDKTQDQGKKITLITRLSPCEAYSGIKIRAQT